MFLNAPHPVSLCEVKQETDQLVVRWETPRESWLTNLFFFFFFPFVFVVNLQSCTEENERSRQKRHGSVQNVSISFLLLAPTALVLASQRCFLLILLILYILETRVRSDTTTKDNSTFAIVGKLE